MGLKPQLGPCLKQPNPDRHAGSAADPYKKRAILWFFRHGPYWNFFTVWKGWANGARDIGPRRWSNYVVFVNEVLPMALQGHIQELSDKHRRIQELIEAEMSHPDWDDIRVAALKKEKLRIKDELERLRGSVN
jgi:hypothetical protein